jgi:putative FmdB family regulatory protein
MSQSEYRCRQCGHEFSLLPSTVEKEARCPRCGSESLERSAYLLGTESAEGLLPEDYFEIALAPCCTLGFKGWHQSNVKADTSAASGEKGSGDEEERHGPQG